MTVGVYVIFQIKAPFIFEDLNTANLNTTNLVKPKTQKETFIIMEYLKLAKK